MNDLTFLNEELSNEYGTSDATLKAVLPGGKVIHITDIISPLRFLDTCPLLYHSFEYNSESRLQASIETSSENAIISLVRYCYTGSYLASESDGDTVLLLQHAETYKIAEDFDVPELQIVAHGNFSCQIEYACCLSSPPRDLLDTIRFVYRHFASDEARRKHNLVDTLLNYCVAVYFTHKLGEDLDFLTAVHEISAFRQDLCRTNIARNFEDDCAAEIIRLPSGSIAESSRHPTTLSSRDLPEEMLYNIPRGSASAQGSEIPISLSSHPQLPSSSMHPIGPKPFPRKIPNPSQHSVEPQALTKALKKLNEESFSYTELDTTIEQTLRRYKRARFAETEARLPGKPTLPEGGPSNAYSVKEETPAASKLDTVTASDEESYWEGAFKQTEMRSSAVMTEGTSASARRLIFEYGRRNFQPEQKATLSPPTIDTGVATALPHRPRDSESIFDETMPIDDASEDDGFAVVRRLKKPQKVVLHSPMSSPELVPATSIAQAMADDKASSDDGWTML